MNTEKIGYVEAIALIAIVMINKIILNTPKNIISNIGSASWINVIYISIISIVVAFLATTILKHFPGKDILDISFYLRGNLLKKIIGFLYIFLLIALTIYVIKNLSETLRIIYFRNSPTWFIISFFIISCIFSNRLGLKTIAKANLTVSPIIALSIIIILASSLKNFMPERIFPILGYGTNQTFLSGLTNLFSFSGILYLLFLPPLLEKPEKLRRLGIVSVIISGIYLLLSVICLLLSLSFTMHSNESFSLYVLTRNLNFGRFIQRVDAVFILVWIISIISYINIPVAISIYIFKKITNFTNTNIINYGINLIIFIACIIPIEYAFFVNIFGQFIQNYFLVLFFAISLPILIFAILKLVTTNRKEQKCLKKSSF